MGKTFVLIFTVIIFLFPISSFAFLDVDWVFYKSDDYGFQLKLHKGTRFMATDFGEGWEGKTGVFNTIRYLIAVKLGPEETEINIQKSLARTINIPAEQWSNLKEGKNNSGWEWYKVIKASKDETLYIGGYGFGLKGNYIILMKTNNTDFETNEAEYLEWFTSIQLF